MNHINTSQVVCRLNLRILCISVVIVSGICAPFLRADVPGFAGQDGSGGQYLAGGTSGGAGGSIVTANTLGDLKNYAESTSAYIIRVEGRLESATPGVIRVKSNKTIIGVGNDAALINYGLSMNGVSNVIIKNLTFRDYYMLGDFDGKMNDYDCIALRDVHHVWIDHCHLSRAGDGLLDMSYGTGYVTVSWTIFSYHNKTSITGGQSVGTFTYDHCWFHNTTQRNVSAEYADVHAFNCYLLGVRSYCMLARSNTRMLIENSFFQQSDDSYYEEGGAIEASGNLFVSVTGRANASGNDLTVPYSYTLDDTADVPAIIKAKAGPGGFENKVDGDVILINFTPTGVYDVKGYLFDYGYAYGNRGNGYSYGWNISNTANAFWRETMTYKEGYTYDVPVDADFRRNSIITTAGGSREWEIGLPNGIYMVHLVCGDPGDPRELTPANNIVRYNHMIIEGTDYYDPDGPLLWDYDEFNAVVEVTDGRLTIEQFVNATYSAALCYVEIRPCIEPVNVASGGPGLKYSYYEGQWEFLPDFDELTAVNEGVMTNFDLLFVPEGVGDFGAVFEGYIEAPTDGLYTFSVESDDAARLMIGGTEVVDKDGRNPLGTSSGQIMLKSGFHPIRLEMFMYHNDNSYNRRLYVNWDIAGMGSEPISRQWLLRDWIYGDFTGDGVVDAVDLSIFTEAWLYTNCEFLGRWDDNGDCMINLIEFGRFAENWMEGMDN